MTWLEWLSCWGWCGCCFLKSIIISCVFFGDQVQVIVTVPSSPVYSDLRPVTEVSSANMSSLMDGSLGGADVAVEGKEKKGSTCPWGVSVLSYSVWHVFAKLSVCQEVCDPLADRVWQIESVSFPAALEWSCWRLSWSQQIRSSHVLRVSRCCWMKRRLGFNPPSTDLLVLSGNCRRCFWDTPDWDRSCSMYDWTLLHQNSRLKLKRWSYIFRIYTVGAPSAVKVSELIKLASTTCVQAAPNLACL